MLKSREISRERSISINRLNWWEQSIGELPEANGHEPITRILKRTLAETSVRKEVLMRMVNYQIFDVERGDMSTMGEMEVYAENTRSLLLYMNLHLLKIDSKDAYLAASHLGRCLGICDIIKKVPFYIAKHRNYIPVEILHKVRHLLTI